MTDLDDDALTRLIDAEGLVPEPDIARARRAASEAGMPLVSAMLELGLLPEEQLYASIASSLGHDLLDETDLAAPLVRQAALASGLSPSFLEKSGLVPVEVSPAGATFATSRLDAGGTARDLAFHLGSPVEIRLACPSTVRAALQALGPSVDPAE